MNRYLKFQTTQKFKLNVPGAEDVVIIIGDEWFHLEKKGDLFEGDIEIRKGKIGVYAKFLDKENYTGLLEYTGF
jgi:hypothetical protein